ncbi:MAG: hypothetical protein LJE94_13065 [Deltaproteobacteria bacterium]|nr:hypothetical protein [Deltaproteobacteria bacterium]
MSLSVKEKAAGKRVIVDGILVDVTALKSIRHRCLPEGCRETVNCCSCFRIHIGEEELKTIVGFLPLVKAYKPSIGREEDDDNVFEEDGDGGYIVDADEDERCVFAYSGRKGETLCSLHSAAVDMDMPPVNVKPKCCSLWPLALSCGPVPELSVNLLATSFPCNRKHAGEDIDEGIKETIRIYFGTSFLERLLALI